VVKTQPIDKFPNPKFLDPMLDVPDLTKINISNISTEAE